MKSGVYKIINLQNGKFYIGSSIELDDRFKNHLHELRKNIHKNRYLQNSFNKYGESSFIFHILEYCSPKRALKIEQIYLDGLNPHYNIAKNCTASMRGLTHSNKTKSKMSQTSKNLNRYNDLKDAIEKFKIPVIDTLGNKFNSLTEAAKFHSISIPTVDDILKRRHYLTNSGVSFNYKDLPNLPYPHKKFNGEFRGIAYNKRRKSWNVNLTLKSGKVFRKTIKNKEIAIEYYRDLYYNEYRIKLCELKTSL